jgi:hypothetical protein
MGPCSLQENTPCWRPLLNFIACLMSSVFGLIPWSADRYQGMAILTKFCHHLVGCQTIGLALFSFGHVYIYNSFFRPLLSKILATNWRLDLGGNFRMKPAKQVQRMYYTAGSLFVLFFYINEIGTLCPFVKKICTILAWSCQNHNASH